MPHIDVEQKTIPAKLKGTTLFYGKARDLPREQQL
jgi:hypothetical protein